MAKMTLQELAEEAAKWGPDKPTPDLLGWIDVDPKTGKPLPYVDLGTIERLDFTQDTIKEEYRATFTNHEHCSVCETPVQRLISFTESPNTFIKTAGDSCSDLHPPPESVNMLICHKCLKVAVAMMELP